MDGVICAKTKKSGRRALHIKENQALPSLTSRPVSKWVFPLRSSISPFRYGVPLLQLVPEVVVDTASESPAVQLSAATIRPPQEHELGGGAGNWLVDPQIRR